MLEAVKTSLRRVKILRDLKRALVGPRLAPHLRAMVKIEGMISLREADLLYRLASAVDQGCIVEVGSYRGRSTVALAQGSLAGHGAPVFAIDPHETFEGILGGSFGPDDRAAFFRTMLTTSSYPAVRLVNLSSEVVTPGWKHPVELLWIDGDHRYEGVRRDWQCWSPHLTERGRVVFDDALNPEIGPRKLIDELVASGELEVVETVEKVAVLRHTSAAG